MKKLTDEELKDLEKWETEEKTVTLTRGQWCRLTTYLIMSTSHRTGEAKAWAELAEEKDENEKPKYKNAASNAEYWAEMVREIEAIKEIIDEA